MEKEREGSRTEEHFVSTACWRKRKKKKEKTGQTSLRWPVWFGEYGRWFVAGKRSAKLRWYFQSGQLAQHGLPG